MSKVTNIEEEYYTHSPRSYFWMIVPRLTPLQWHLPIYIFFSSFRFFSFLIHWNLNPPVLIALLVIIGHHWDITIIIRVTDKYQLLTIFHFISDKMLAKDHPCRIERHDNRFQLKRVTNLLLLLLLWKTNGGLYILKIKLSGIKIWYGLFLNFTLMMTSWTFPLGKLITIVNTH